MGKKKYVQVAHPDKDALADFLKQAKGPDRSMAKFSEDSGVNPATLSKIMTGKIERPVTVAVLTKIFNARAETASFYFEDFALANGLEELGSVVKRNEEKEAGFNVQDESESFDRKIRDSVTVAMVERGFSIRSMSSDELKANGMHTHENGYDFKADFAYFINDNEGSVYQWQMFIKNGSWVFKNPEVNFVKEFMYFMSATFNTKDFDNKKVSFVFSWSENYESFINLFGTLPIKVATSAILVDVHDGKVCEETWLYKPDDISEALSKPLVKYENAKS